MFSRCINIFIAIFALLLGKYYGWNWVDPIKGIVGGIIITKWSIGLVKETSPICWMKI